jgi:uncharacterized protein YjbI with pentapeptide repeats
MEQHTFEERLVLHRQWLQSAGAAGQRADFTGADLRSCPLEAQDLRRALLVRAQLGGTVLQDTNLEEADLTEADLSGASLHDTNLRNARLCNANLEGADLSRAKYVKASQFGGCNAFNSLFSDGIQFTEGLELANEAIQRIAIQFVSTATLCLYSWLAIGSTSDPELLTNASSLSFPLIDFTLPIVSLYFVAPLMVLVFSTSFYLHLSMLWEYLAGLPARFQNGDDLTRKLHPTLLNSMVDQYMLWLSHGRMNRTAHQLTLLLIHVGMHGLAPMTLLAFWLRYLPRHDPLGTSLHLVLLCASILQAWFFNLLLQNKLRMRPHSTGIMKKPWQLLLLLGTCIGLIALSGWAFRGTRHPISLFDADLSDTRLGHKEVQSDAEDTRRGPGAELWGRNLRYATLESTSAENANLSESNLEHANLVQAVLRNANLKEANLGHASLRDTQLQGADLRKARLDGTQLSNADLSQANLAQAEFVRTQMPGTTLTGANFSQSRLEGVNLHGARGEAPVFALARMSNVRLSHVQLPRADFFLADMKESLCWRANFAKASFILADLSRANLSHAQLVGADFSQSDLRRAILTKANLQGAQLVFARLEDATLSGATLTEANLKGALLNGADLEEANLEGAQLTDVSLEDVNLKGAVLRGADLRGVDLSRTRGLSLGQLTHALLDEHTHLPAELEAGKAGLLRELKAHDVP